MGTNRWLATYLHLKSELTLQMPDGAAKYVAGQDRLQFEMCDIVPELNGYTFDELTTSIQYRIRRATLRLELVRQESNPRFAFYMFKRLNKGGEPLSNQEARNCSIRLLGTAFTDFIYERAAYPPFLECVDDVTEEFRNRMGLSELVLRFYAFKNMLDKYVHDIDPFLTDYMERVTSASVPFDTAEEQAVFEKTFQILAKTLKEKTGRRWTRHAFQGGFSVSHYEAFAIGISRVSHRIDVADSVLLERIKVVLERTKQEEELRALTTGGGKNFNRLYSRKIAMVEEAIKAIL